MNKKELWLNLANYHFEHLAPTHLWDEIAAKFGGQNPFAKAFADKLSRKLKWKKTFAMKALWEYKKFVYLGVISDFSITPSKVIDEVWHQHLLFSSGYRKFCKDVIHYDLDHNPELVAVDSQSQAFQSQYFQTIALYKREFGVKPPDDIWGTTKFEETKKIKETADSFLYSSSYDSSDTLISMFPATAIGDVESGGGEFGGGGASGSWGSDESSSDSGGDSGGGSDSSCSSCSSSSCSGGGD
jgi:hypothetical protein